MKIRWTDGSLRLRITPDELNRLAAGEAVEETLTLPGNEKPVWRAAVRGGAAESRVSEAAGALQVGLTDADVARLAAPDTEGVYFNDAGPGFSFYIEKDFPCIHPRAAELLEKLTPTFAPPPGFAERKAE